MPGGLVQARLPGFFALICSDFGFGTFSSLVENLESQAKQISEVGEAANCDLIAINTLRLDNTYRRRYYTSHGRRLAARSVVFMAKKKNAALSSLQMEVMQIIWDRQEVTVGEVLELISAKREIARNTVQTTLVRLEQKGWLKHRQVANAFRYSSAIGRQASLKGMLHEFVDRAFKGSVEGLVMALLEQQPLSRDEADRIRKIIDESEKKGK
jgi:predicted transcriptional regulator